MDIPNRKKSGIKLSDKLNLYKVLLDNIPSMIALILKKHTREIVACNEFARQLGAVIGKTCFETLAKESAPCPFCRAPELWATGEKQEIESEYIGKFWKGYWFPLTDDLYVHYIFDITERKLSEDKLKESERRFRETLENLNLIAVQLDRNGTITFANRFLADITGWKLNDIIGKNWFALFIPESIRDTIRKLHAVNIKGNVVQKYENVILTQNGEERLISWANSQLFDLKGNLVGTTSLGADITEQKRTEGVLQENEEKFRSLFNNAEVGMFRTKLDGSMILDMNDKFLSIFGRTREEMQSSPSIIHWADPREREEMVRRLKSEGRVTNFECKMLNKRGETRQCITSLRLYPEQEILEGSIIDITEQRTAEKYLIESEQRYRILLDSVTDYIYTVEVRDGKTVSTSHGPGCVAVTGYSPEDFKNDPYLWYNMIYPEDKDHVRSLLKDIFLDKQIFPVEHRIICRDGSVKWVRNSTVKHYDGHGNITAYDGLVADITEQKRLELQLQHAHKMESIGTLAGGIAHDFNNILTAIIGFASIVNKRMPDDDPLHVYMDNIEEAAEKAANLTRSLLTFSRKQQTHPILVNISEVIGRMEKMLRRIIGEDIELRLVVADDPLYVKADVGQIEQVIMNLTANARDAMPQGGSLSVSTETFIMEDGFERHHGYGKPGPYALIKISDTGSGMDDSTRDKIFEPFFTTKEVDKGTGLGLSIVYGIIKQHNGYISVDSMPGKGTTFKIYLPMLKKHDDMDLYDMKSETALSVRGSETILFAEDDEMVRSFIVNILSDSGYKIIEAKDGQEAVDKFIEDKDRVQFVILDAIMPRKNGGQVFLEMRKIRPDIKGIFLSGYSTDRLIMEESANMFKFISKPVKPHELLKAIREEMDSR